MQSLDFRGFVPSQWKVAQIIMIQKPGEPAELAEYTNQLTPYPIETIWETSIP